MKNNTDIKSKIENYLDRYNTEWVFSGNVVVTKDNEVIVERAYGHASLEHSVKNNVNTKFNIASLTKAFTATAVMMLKEKGLLSLEESINKHLPQYKEFSKEITIHHLLSQTSGIMNYNNLDGFFEKTKMMHYSNDEFVGLFKDQPLEFSPGEKFSYSNSGYYLLGMIIEKVSGVSYEEFIQTNILSPLEMTNSGLFNERKIISNFAKGYELLGDTLSRDSFSEWSKFSASGGIYSNLKDMTIWSASILDRTLLESDSYDEMFKNHTKEYGYGWFIGEHNKRRRLAHNGAHNGYISQYNIFPDDGISILIMCNHRFIPTWEIIDNISDIIFTGNVPIVEKSKAFDIDKQLYSDYVGEYENPGDENIVVSSIDGKIYMQFEAPHKFEIYPTSNNNFHHLMIDEQYEFVDTGVEIYGDIYKKVK